MPAVGTVLLSVVALGCGREERTASAPSVTAPAVTQRSTSPADMSDRARARAALVRRADFRSKENSNVSARSTAIPRFRCVRNPFRGARVVVSSPRVRLGHTTGLQERIAVFADAATMGRSSRRLSAPASIACFRREVRREMSSEAEGPASPVRLLRAERIGRSGSARRYTGSAISAAGIVHTYIDDIQVKVGRSLGILVMVSRERPPDEDLYERAVDLFKDRLRRMLA